VVIVQGHLSHFHHGKGGVNGGQEILLLLFLSKGSVVIVGSIVEWQLTSAPDRLGSLLLLLSLLLGLLVFSLSLLHLFVIQR